MLFCEGEDPTLFGTPNFRVRLQKSFSSEKEGALLLPAMRAVTQEGAFQFIRVSRRCYFPPPFFTVIGSIRLTDRHKERVRPFFIHFIRRALTHRCRLECRSQGERLLHGICNFGDYRAYGIKRIFLPRSQFTMERKRIQ